MTAPGSGPAPDWGVGHYERTAELLLPAARVLVEAAGVAPGERVLDVGAGTGNVALLAAAAGAEVTAVDPSARLLGVAGATAAARGRSLRCEIGEAAQLPVPDRSFDAVLSNFGLIFAPGPEQAVTEMGRVLTDGGRAAFTSWLPGGAVGAMAEAATELVRAAVGAPPAAPGFAWHDEAAVSELFDRIGLRASPADTGELVFTAASPRAYLEAQRADHPMALSAFQLLSRLGKGDESERRLLEVLEEHNEDPDGFRSTSRYQVFVARAC